MEYFIHLAILFSLSALFAISLDLLIGYTGLISVTQASFGGVSAYTVALLTLNYHVNFFIAMLAGVLLASLTALIVGFVFSRFRGDYYILGTIGFSYIAFSVFLNWQSLTGGPLGIPGIPRPEIFGFAFSDNTAFLALTIGTLGLLYLCSRFIVNSSFGRVLKAIREDEEAVSVFGYRALFYKLAIFVIAAAMMGIGGALYAPFLTYIDPFAFGLTPSIYILTVVILGGLGSLRGPIVGAGVLIALLEGLRFAGFPPDVSAQLQQLIYGLLLVGLMLYRPQGLLGEFRL